MLSENRSKQILTVGCAFDPPRGGVAQVIYTYSREVYPVFRCVINSVQGSVLAKFWQAVRGLMEMALLLTKDKNLRIVHIHTASYNSFRRSTWYMHLAKAMRRKTVLHIHGGGFRDYFKTDPKWILNELHKADCVLALTDGWRHFFLDELHIPKVITVPNIIPSPQTTVNKVDNRLHLLFLGLITEEKGIFDLIEVIKEHKAEWDGKLLLHIGGSKEVERLQIFINIHQLENLIHYEGWVSGDKKVVLLNTMHALILPSYTEGLPISLLEALSYGKPVIATHVGGIPEVVNESNGFLFSPGDLNAMYEIINRIILNPTLLASMAKDAKKTVTKNSPESVSTILEEVYDELLYV